MDSPMELFLPGLRCFLGFHDWTHNECDWKVCVRCGNKENVYKSKGFDQVARAADKVKQSYGASCEMYELILRRRQSQLESARRDLTYADRGLARGGLGDKRFLTQEVERRIHDVEDARKDLADAERRTEERVNEIWNASRFLRPGERR